MDKNIDMTDGKPIRLILMFAIPLFIGNIFQQLYSMIDTMIAGYFIGSHAIASIGATESIISLIISFAIGLNGGYAILLTRFVGAKNKKSIREVVACMFFLNIFFGILITSLIVIILPSILNILNTPSEIYVWAYDYILVISLGLTLTILYNMFASILRSFGNSKIPLYFLIISSIVNIILDYILIVYFKMGVRGAGLATIIAQGFSAFLSYIYILKNYKEFLPNLNDYKNSIYLVKDVFSSGLAMALMLCVVSIGSVILQRAVNYLGSQIITAHISARRIINTILEPMSTVAMAFSVFVGQNYGAKKFSRIKESLRQVLGMEIIWAMFCSFVILIWGRQLVTLTTGIVDKGILDNSYMNLTINSIFFSPLGILLCLRTSLQAMGQKIVPVLSSTIELVFKVFASFFLIPKFNYRGASFAEPITWLLCGIYIFIYVQKEKEKLLPT